MFMWLIFVVTLLITAGDLAEPTMECGINRNGEAYFVEFEGTFMGIPWLLLFLISFLLYTLLDITTIFLYWCKIRSLRKYRENKLDEIYSRIQHILYRVLILTFFYQIGGLLVYIINAVLTEMSFSEEFNVIGAAVISVLVRYSMFLMQEHNTDEYIAFLRILNRYKLYLCCCCCCRMVRNQYAMMNKEEEGSTVRKERIMSVTPDVSVTETQQTYGTGKTGMELSVPTRTVVADSSVQMD